jgi:D-psicose/D-tagatose/L-ribulose 3-epimerase
MRIGVSAFAWTADFNESHLEVLPLLREYGLSAFEVPMFDPSRLPAGKIRRAMEANELACTVCAILPAGINPVSADEPTRRKSIQHLTACVEACREMGAQLLGGPIYSPIGYLPGRRRTPDDWNFAIECLTALTPVLDDCEVDLSLEPVNRSETFLINTAQDAFALCEEINHPRIGVTIDTFHANIEEKSTAQAIRSLGKRLKHIHASENDRGLLGSGQVDFPAIVSALREVDYAGYLMIEGFGYSPIEPKAPGFLWADVTVSPENIALGGYRYLRSLTR